MARKIRVGLDFDGVVAYNPARVIRAPIKWFKRKFLGVSKLKFYVPKSKLGIIMWTLVHESSIFPGKGVDLLRRMHSSGKYEFFLVTARYPFLGNNLYAWLDKHDLKKIFKSITINEQLDQPHIYKKNIIEKLKFDYFVEDNLDIVNYVSGKVKARVFWIYNILDRKVDYQYKFPYLEKALEKIRDENTF